jgi:hypothetical protein
MNPEAQADFDRIVSLSVEELRETDIAILKARSSYLTESQREKFHAVFNPTPTHTYRELQKLAAQKGIKTVGMTRKQLEEAINN